MSKSWEATESFWREGLSSPRFVAAPMVELSHLAFRLLCRRHGAQLAYTPMLHAHQFATDSLYRMENFTTSPEDRPLIVQFCANDPDTFLAAARLVEDQCDAVDLNLGCPQVIAKRGYYGAYLQDDWDLIRRIVSHASSHLSIPVACKVRIFPDVSRSVEYARMLEDAGCRLLTVHGRTREQRAHATGLADWETIRVIRESVHVPIFANGNILSFQDVQDCLKRTEVHGVMSAEGLLHNPALFSGSNPLVWEIAEEYLSICAQYPPHPRVIRTVLFRIWAYCLPRFKDLQKSLGEASDLPTFVAICGQLKAAIVSQVGSDVGSEAKMDDRAATEGRHRLGTDKAHESQKPVDEIANADKESCAKGEEVEEGQRKELEAQEEVQVPSPSSSARSLENKDGGEVFGAENFPPFWICHSRPRVILDEKGTPVYRKSLPSESEREMASQEGIPSASHHGNVLDVEAGAISKLETKSEKTELLSKNVLRKQRRHQRIVDARKLRRQQQKARRKLRILEQKQQLANDPQESKGEGDSVEEPHISKRRKKQMVKERMEKAMENAPKVCVDLGFGSLMTEKELDRLASQLRRLYGSNRASESPLHIYFTNFSRDSALYQACVRKNDGFEKYTVEMTDRSHEDLFPKENLVYLSPDSPHVLEKMQSDKVYIIGGLVDETVNKNCSLERATSAGVSTARLPIAEVLARQSKGSFSQVLAVNQVFDILLHYFAVGDWTEALLAGVPQRKGFTSATSSQPPPSTDN